MADRLVLSLREPVQAHRALMLTLPWPPKELSPNARVHWRTLGTVKKAYRAACAWTAREQGARRVQAERLHKKTNISNAKAGDE